jgi:hypothetical protein
VRENITYHVGRRLAIEDEERVATGANDEHAPGAQPPHHRRRRHSEEREGDVQDSHRHGAQVAVLQIRYISMASNTYIREQKDGIVPT